MGLMTAPTAILFYPLNLQARTLLTCDGYWANLARDCSVLEAKNFETVNRIPFGQKKFIP